MTQDTLRADLLVVGGGPAGLAAAIAARQKGFSVIVADHANPPIDKACGEGLMPDGVAALNRLGIALELHQALPFRGICFTDGQDSVATAFPQGLGWGIRRPVLHELLVRRAVRAGVSIFWGARLNWLNNGEVVLNKCRIECRWIIGADGHHSRARQWMKLDQSRFKRNRFGFRQHYRVTPWSDFVELHWGRNCQIVVTPVGHQEVCLAVVSDRAQLRLEEALQQFPEILRRLKGAVATTEERGAISAVCSLRKVYRGRYVLIGDASGSVDAITGKGLCLAFQQALFLADALERGKLWQYQAAHRRLARLPTLMSWLMLSMDRHAWIRERALCALMREPPLFSRLLATHVGALSPLAFGFSNALKMGWKFVAYSD
jgi:flavin-dependent dehydrogenase